MKYRLPNLLMASLLAGVAGDARAGTLTVTAEEVAETPSILAYNVGHIVPGSNAMDWWRYAGVNGARAFVSPADIEPTDDIPGVGDGVKDRASFVARRAALRRDPLDNSYINWPAFKRQYETNLLGRKESGNRFRVNDAFAKLREQNIQILVQITGSANALPIAGDDDWAGKWELWQHYYAQAFYLGRRFDVERFQMYNEPNHPNAKGLTQDEWLMRLRLASDAIQSALADVNERYGKSLKPAVYAPVNTGGALSSAGKSWGGLAVRDRHVDFLGVTDPRYLVMQRYDYHSYNKRPDKFGSDLGDLNAWLAGQMKPEMPFPTSVSEFNVHNHREFDTIDASLDDPAIYARFGAIAVAFAKNHQDEMYCFKFAQTPSTKGDRFPVVKNGMHYVQNRQEPFNYGGPTKAAEVWRLFVKAFVPGGRQLKVSADRDLADVSQIATYSPATGNYCIFSANNTDAPVKWSIDAAAWDVRAGSRFLIEEVSQSCFGGGRTIGTASRDGKLADAERGEFVQPANTVWLLTVPKASQQPERAILASEDATVADGANAAMNYGGAKSLFVRAGATSTDDRKVAFIKFKLPAVNSADLQLAVLSLSGRATVPNETAQSFVYAIDDRTWKADAINWANAPNLLKDHPAGNRIEDRVVADQGGTAHVVGQVVVSGSERRTQLIDVTRFLKSHAGSEISFLICQDPRWDLDLSKPAPAFGPGDTQRAGLEFTSIEGGDGAPQLQIIFRASPIGPRAGGRAQ